MAVGVTVREIIGWAVTVPVTANWLAPYSKRPLLSVIDHGESAIVTKPLRPIGSIQSIAVGVSLTERAGALDEKDCVTESATDDAPYPNEPVTAPVPLL